MNWPLTRRNRGRRGARARSTAGGEAPAASTESFDGSAISVQSPRSPQLRHHARVWSPPSRGSETLPADLHRRDRGATRRGAFGLLEQNPRTPGTFKLRRECASTSPLEPTEAASPIERRRSPCGESSAAAATTRPAPSRRLRRSCPVPGGRYRCLRLAPLSSSPPGESASKLETFGSNASRAAQYSHAPRLRAFTVGRRR